MKSVTGRAQLTLPTGVDMTAPQNRTSTATSKATPYAKTLPSEDAHACNNVNVNNYAPVCNNMPMTRSALAQRFYPEQPAPVAGFILAGIINHYPSLKAQLREAGWQPNKRGYSARQVEIICRFMAEHPSLRVMEHVVEYVPGRFRKKIKR